jgi:choline dehydrogenase-like flavoprotein
MTPNAHIGFTCEWDVVIVGTGMGGATLGYVLARQGSAVLFLARGRIRSPL